MYQRLLVGFLGLGSSSLGGLSENWLSSRDRAILEKLIEDIEDYLESALGIQGGVDG